ncbi:DNA topology modulation protein FlaR [Paenibacillus xylanexedens]|uniref:DNA topology modulation protein FlaR n=1 Tax=Paenibacillus xylanexedens TaxID=528191 RepID=UPI001F33468E|nr:DNA topology modulation protein FlaR [Paenibacillus xylanexedens]MCF7755042.1 DNA topology modulation protein FlaR [Paenibacillus xylanexedens]
MSRPLRIHIIGSTGSGKTYLGQVLSEKLNIKIYELDTVMWSSKVEFSGKNSPDVRDKLLHKIIDNDSWIVEGVYYKWLSDSFSRADVIYYLDTNVLIRHFRIIMRFVKQRIGAERSIYKQTLRGLIEMLIWNHKFNSTNRKEICSFLSPYKDKVIILKTNRQMISLLNEGSEIT